MAQKMLAHVANKMVYRAPKFQQMPTADVSGDAFGFAGIGKMRVLLFQCTYSVGLMANFA